METYGPILICMRHGEVGFLYIWGLEIDIYSHPPAVNIGRVGPCGMAAYGPQVMRLYFKLVVILLQCKVLPSFYSSLTPHSGRKFMGAPAERCFRLSRTVSRSGVADTI